MGDYYSNTFGPCKIPVLVCVYIHSDDQSILYYLCLSSLRTTQIDAGDTGLVICVDNKDNRTKLPS